MEDMTTIKLSRKVAAFVKGQLQDYTGESIDEGYHTDEEICYYNEFMEQVKYISDEE